MNKKLSSRDDLTGMVFERLTVIFKSQKTGKNGEIYWYCQCSCGWEYLTESMAANLVSGKAKSCGCLRKENIPRRHGLYSMENKKDLITKKIVEVFGGMWGRCYNPKHIGYPYWGGKGITICDEWRNNIESFYLWALANGYREGLSIERIDNNGNYCPENCKWATREEQSYNKSNTLRFQHDGKNLSTKELIDQGYTSLPRHIIRDRVVRLGKTIQEALEMPYQAKTTNRKEWVNEDNILCTVVSVPNA